MSGEEFGERKSQLLQISGIFQDETGFVSTLIEGSEIVNHFDENKRDDFQWKGHRQRMHRSQEYDT